LEFEYPGGGGLQVITFTIFRSLILSHFKRASFSLNFTLQLNIEKFFNFLEKNFFSYARRLFQEAVKSWIEGELKSTRIE
jgi:hypothetical protein